jgi:hypothetical protein
MPFGAVGFAQTPVVGLHVPTTWHWSNAVHVTGFAPVHTPAWHVSVCVHALESLHADPSALAGFEHPVAGSHVPATWHWSNAAHVTGSPAHTPFTHTSSCVHAFPSLHDVRSDANGFEQSPVTTLHVPATWHWSDAVHITGFDPVHRPA